MASTSAATPSNSLLLVADLQTQLAVLETELRHAKKQRDDAHLGAQALLQLLCSNNNLLLPQLNMEAASRVDGDAVKLKRKYDRVSKECEQLRRKCARLQSKRAQASPAEIKTLTQFITSITSNQQQQSTDSASSRTTNNTHHKAEQATPNDDEDGDHLLSDVSAAIVKVEDVSSPNIEMEDVEDYDSLDDYDTAAEWRVEGRIGDDGKREVIHHFDQIKPVLAARRFQAVKPVDEKYVVETMPIKVEGELTTRQSAEQAALRKHLHAVTNIALQPAPSSKMFRLLPADPSQDYRMISISGLSNDVHLARVLSHVAGGAVVCATLSRDPALTDTTTAYITFFHNASAAAFVDFYATDALVIGEDEVKVELIKAAVIPVALEEMRSNFCTRCITISSKNINLTVENVKDDLFVIDARMRDCIVTAWKIGASSSGVLHVHFVSVDAAIAALDKLSHAIGYRDCNIKFEPDPCARRLEPVKRRDSAVVLKSPQIDALTSGSFRRRPEVNIFKRVPGRRAPRRAYYAYTDLDVFEKGKGVDLAYDDDDVDIEMNDQAANIPSKELDRVIEVGSTSPPTILQPVASTNLSFSLLDTAQVDVEDDHALANQISKSAITNDEVDKLEDEQNDSASRTSSPEAKPVAPGILALAEALVSISGPDNSMLPQVHNSPTAASESSSPSSASTVPKTSAAPVKKLTGLEQSKHATTFSPSHSPADPVLRLPSPPSFGFKFSMPPPKSLPPKPVASSTKSQQRSMQAVSRGRPLVSYDDLYNDQPERKVKDINEQEDTRASTVMKAEQPEDDHDKPRAIPLLGASSNLKNISSGSDADDEIEKGEVDESPSKKIRRRMDVIRDGEEVIEMLDY